MKIKIYIAALSAMMLFSSCNKWLTITPKGNADANELLTSVAGYNSAIGGIYYELSSASLYGREMSYATMDVLSQYWETQTDPSHKYYPVTKYDYTNPNVKTKINNFWKSFYICIAGCNRVIEGLEINRNEIATSELFEGEALGLRAFCHMELFKLFGPVIHNASDLEKKSIAYRTTFDVTALEFMSGSEVLALAEKDLKKALDLLKNDPIIANGRFADGNKTLLDYNAALNKRGNRMNYYAVLAMLARLEQLRLNHDAAYTYADRLIKECETSKAIRLIKTEDLQGGIGNKNYNFAMEMVFGLSDSELWSRADDDFGMNGESPNQNESFRINVNKYNVLRDELYFRSPDGSANDDRYRTWFEEKNSIPGEYDFTKIRRQPSFVTFDIIFPEINIFRLSEAYYIACEAKIGKDNTMALELLNTVRRSRNLQDIKGPVADELLMEYLLREERKDFLGDGTMFSIYKRHFAPIYVKSTLTIEPSDANFVFPIPDAEYEFSPNVKPDLKK